MKQEYAMDAEEGKAVANPDNTNSVLLANPEDDVNGSSITKSENVDIASHPNSKVEKEEASTDETIGQESVYPSPNKPDLNC